MIEIIKVDYKNKTHAQHLVEMLNGYALDPMGGSTELAPEVKETLAQELSKRPHAFSFLAYSKEGDPVGLANCIEGFSSFKAKTLINIHDIYVSFDYRGRGIAQKLLQAVEDEAKERGACKITLEVLSGNKRAQHSYSKFGFEGYSLDPVNGQALFWEKPLF